MKIDLLYHAGIGDTLISTPAVTELKQQYPQFTLRVAGVGSEEIFKNNPSVEGFDGEADKTYFLQDILLKKSSHFHCLESYYQFFNLSLGLNLKKTLNKPLMFLNEEEKENKIGEYALINTGFKKDFTIKNWGFEKYQQVVDSLDITFIQVGKEEDNPKRLKNTIDAVGLTNIRELASLVYNAKFGIGADSLLLHLFACFDKNYFCLKSGFNPANWIRYNKTRILDKANLLACGQNPCWRHRIMPLNDKSIHDHFLCIMPCHDENKEVVPKCMDLISVDDVVGSILTYV